jgi:hypothetical protein
VTTFVTRGARVRFAAGGALLACVLLSACTGSSGSSAAPAGPDAPATSGSAPSAPASSAPASSAPSTPAGSASTPAPPASSSAVAVAGAWSGTGALCPDLQVKLGLAQGTSNTTYQVIDFVNHGSMACIMSGYPGVNLAGGTPTAPIGLPAAHSEFPAARLLSLPPGGVGNALLQITDAHTYATAKCGPVQAQYLIVYRPKKAAPVKLAYGTTACSKPVRMLQISAISLGSGG